MKRVITGVVLALLLAAPVNAECETGYYCPASGEGYRPERVGIVAETPVTVVNDDSVPLVLGALLLGAGVLLGLGVGRVRREAVSK